jgi:hypothetical protein
VPTTVVNPAATAGKAALTLRVPKAVAIELDAVRSAGSASEARARALEARIKEMEAATAARGSAPSTLAPAPASFAPVAVGAATAPAPAAPTTWREVKDPASGRSYWYNSATRETTWVRPAGM